MIKKKNNIQFADVPNCRRVNQINLVSSLLIPFQY